LPGVAEAPRVGTRRDADYRLAELAAAAPLHFWFQRRRALVLWALQRYFPACRTLLEVGCGSGFVLEGLRRQSAALALTACDALHDPLLIVRERVADVHLFQAEAERLPVRTHFDAIAALDVLEHIDNDRKALVEMRRAVKPNGGLVLTVPQHQWLWSASDDFSHHRRRYSRRELVDRTKAAGFEILRCSSFFSTTLPFLAMARRRSQSKAYDPVAELRLSRPLNALFHALLGPEWILLKAGVSLPAGSSLLLIARRPAA
jgi:SAM-dependent methyltransferase